MLDFQADAAKKKQTFAESNSFLHYLIKYKERSIQIELNVSEHIVETQTLVHPG